MRALIAVSLVMSLQQVSFKESQLKHSRVNSAYQEKERLVKEYFTNKQLDYGGFHLFIRAFKQEKLLEIWIKEKGDETHHLLTTYPICTTSGVLGPKRKEGDLQIPEGVYRINHFNPVSTFHLSLGVSYPNASDRILSDPKHPGGAIYIHGNCVTLGCLPITDDRIKELYVLAVEANNNGQTDIPLHIFPAKFDQHVVADLKEKFEKSPATIRFWENLKIVYDDFEKLKTLKRIRVNNKGEYYF